MQIRVKFQVRGDGSPMVRRLATVEGFFTSILNILTFIPNILSWTERPGTSSRTRESTTNGSHPLPFPSSSADAQAAAWGWFSGVWKQWQGAIADGRQGNKGIT